MSSGVDPASLVAALPRLTQETELQKMLADEKMRSEQHKTNYQTLKAEHSRLEDEYVSLQQEMKATIEETHLVKEKYKGLLKQAQSDISVKHKDNEDLRSQVMSDERMEVMKLQIQDEVEKTYRDRYAQLDLETDSIRNAYNKLKYDYTFLKSEYEHDQQEHQRMVDEMRLRHEAEVTNLRKDKEAVVARYQSEGSGEGQRVRSLQRDNAQLNLKVKGLLSELEEIRAQREHMGLQSDSVARLQTKQLAEHGANVKALQTERESLQRQCESLQREVTLAADLHTQLTGKHHDLEKENIVLKNRVDETTHKSRVELTNLRMEMVKERGELERQRDQLTNQVEELQSQLDIVKHSADVQSNALVEKEREANRRVQAAREEEWKKLHTLQTEKMEMETKVQEIERRRVEDEATRHAERERNEEKMRVLHDAKDSAEREALVYKTKVSQHESLAQQVERERLENADLKKRLYSIESQFSSYVSSERELVALNDQLKAQQEKTNQELTRCKDELRAIEGKTEKVLSDTREVWSEEKKSLVSRTHDLQSHLADTEDKLEAASKLYARKKKRFARFIHKLKDKNSLCVARIEELETEVEALKRAVPMKAHQEIKARLKDLLRRHQDFRSLLLTSSVSQVGDQAAQSLNASLLHSETTKDLEALKERLDILDDQQKVQLRELKGDSCAVTHRAERDTGALALSDLGSDGGDSLHSH